MTTINFQLLLKNEGPYGGFAAVVKANGKARRLYYSTEYSRGQFNFSSKEQARTFFKRWTETAEAKRWAVGQ